MVAVVYAVVVFHNRGGGFKCGFVIFIRNRDSGFIQIIKFVIIFFIPRLGCHLKVTYFN